MFLPRDQQLLHAIHSCIFVFKNALIRNSTRLDFQLLVYRTFIFLLWKKKKKKTFAFLIFFFSFFLFVIVFRPTRSVSKLMQERDRCKLRTRSSSGHTEIAKVTILLQPCNLYSTDKSSIDSSWHYVYYQRVLTVPEEFYCNGLTLVR